MDSPAILRSSVITSRAQRSAEESPLVAPKICCKSCKVSVAVTSYACLTATGNVIIGSVEVTRSTVGNDLADGPAVEARPS